MVRISASFTALCMVLIAASLGAALFLSFGFSLTDSALSALGILTALAIYNAVAGRKSDRAEVNDQVSGLARGSSDIARQVAEFGRRLGAMEGKLECVADKASSTAVPLAAEIEELSRLVRQLADSVARHETALNSDRGAIDTVPAPPSAPTTAAAVSAAEPAAAALPQIAAFAGLANEVIIA